MQSFKDYLIDEFRDKAKNYVAVEFKFAHYIKLKSDKSSGVNLKIDVVKIAMRFVDKDMNTLYNCSVVFENNVIPKNKEKNFVNISAKDLNNKFAFAKAEIIKIIMQEYIEKRDELNTKINSIKTYSGNTSDIITPRMKGEVVNVVDAPRKKNDLNKRTRFDM